MNKPFFYEQIKDSLFNHKLSQSQVQGMEAILDTSGIVSTNELAYIFATIYHETAKTMQPIEEYGKGRSRTYGHKVKQSGKSYNDTENIFYGRGFVQLTWYENYAKMGKVIGENLIKYPELCLTIPFATKICYAGMIGGLFTGKKLSDYINDMQIDFVNARRIINRLDCADLIASYANKFLAALKEN